MEDTDQNLQMRMDTAGLPVRPAPRVSPFLQQQRVSSQRASINSDSTLASTRRASINSNSNVSPARQLFLTQTDKLFHQRPWILLAIIVMFILTYIILIFTAPDGYGLAYGGWAALISFGWLIPAVWAYMYSGKLKNTIEKYKRG